MTYNIPMSFDEKWMRRALALAERGRGRVHPNPMVGALLVRQGRIVGTGYHAAFGKPHAEVGALEAASAKARGSTLYVNLEPCAHWGKTPPCVDALVRAGVKRVVASMRDPNPLVSGKGFAALKRHGISVTTGLLEEEARELNKAFVIWVTRKRPFVTLKVASSLDGRTATITGESKWITGLGARQAGHRLRAEVDAIAVGANTVIRDNPSLTAHGQGRDPVRILFAGRRPVPRQAKIFDTAAPTWVLKKTRGKTGLHKALAELARRGIAHLLVEGGMTLQQSFLDAGVVDEVVWFMAPMIIGNAKHLKNAQGLENLSVCKIGKDLCVRGDVHRNHSGHR
jgi:diaminohydroxyphosphoribosylaminopyrimidine deaminase/5-amino-6-(5-phosphoribosylamino)uracil reductase